MSWFRKNDSSSAPPLPASAAAPMAAPAAASGSGARSAAAQAIADNFTMYTDQLNTLSAVCWEKCITKKSQPDLSMGELSCDDRCVIKYLATTTKVADVFQNIMMQGQQPQQPGQQ